LDAIGWAKTDPPPGAQIDLGEDGWALVRALTSALEFADEDVSEPAHGDAERDAQHGLAPEPGAEVERAEALWDLKASVQARIDALAVREEAGTVLDLAA